MSLRATKFGVGAPGGAVDYRGDLPAPVTTYAGAYRDAATSHLRVPASTVVSGSAVVMRAPRRNGHAFFYSHGGVPMALPLARPGVGAGGVESSQFQRTNVQLMDWQINSSWHEAGYPRNLGLSTRVPQPTTNQTGGPGRSQMVQRPLFTRVQSVPRARVLVRAYPTRSTNRG